MSGSSLSLTGGRAVWVSLGAGRRLSASDVPAPSLADYLTSWQIPYFVDSFSSELQAMGFASRGTADRPDSARLVIFWAPKERLSRIVAKVLRSVRQGDWLWIVIANSPDLEWTRRRTTPFLVYRPPSAPSLLSSATTRQPGVVSSIDLVPSLLAYLSGLAPSSLNESLPAVTGSPVRFVPHPDPVSFLTQLDQKSTLALSDLPFLTLAVIVLIVDALLLTVISLFVPQIRFLAHLTILSGMSLPLSLLVSYLFPHSDPGLNLFQCFAMAFGIGSLHLVLRYPPLFFAGIVGGLSALTALFALPAYSCSPLGYFLTTGWRFYGITNSGVGIILAGSLLFLYRFPLPKVIGFVICFGAVFLTGAGFWGANYGGALTLSLTLFLYLLRQPSRSVTVRSVFLSIGITALIIQSIFVAEKSLFPHTSGHIRHITDWLTTGQFATVLDFVLQKVQLWKLFSTSLPLNLLIIAFFAMMTIAIPFGLKYFQIREHQPFFTFLFIGSWVGFFTNDSGVEILGMSLIYLGGYTLLLILENFGGLIRKPWFSKMREGVRQK